jgi:hypothetical protein
MYLFVDDEERSCGWIIFLSAGEWEFGDADNTTPSFLEGSVLVSSDVAVDIAPQTVEIPISKKPSSW